MTAVKFVMKPSRQTWLCVQCATQCARIGSWANPVFIPKLVTCSITTPRVSLPYLCPSGVRKFHISFIRVDYKVFVLLSNGFLGILEAETSQTIVGMGSDGDDLHWRRRDPAGIRITCSRISNKPHFKTTRTIHSAVETGRSIYCFRSGHFIRLRLLDHCYAVDHYLPTCDHYSVFQSE